MKQNWKQKACSLVACGAMLMGMLTTTGYVHAEGETTKTVKNATELQEALNSDSTEQVVKLLNDIDVSSTSLRINRTVTLDLNGKKLLAGNTSTGTIVITKGQTILQDSTGNGEVYTNTDYDGTTNTTNSMIQVNGGASFVMNSGYLNAVRENPSNKGQTAVMSAEGGNITINGGKIEAGWYAVAGNGNDKATTSTITINGGELISSADYAIYHPQNGTLNICGGTIYGQAGGIAVNRGTINISNGLITSKGLGDTGNWGDGTGNMGNAALNLNGKYGEIKANIKGGQFVAEGDAVVIEKGSANPVSLDIQGGQFSSDPTSLLNEGYKAYPANGGYVVAPKATGITLDKKTLSLEAGSTGKLTATKAPENTLETPTWTTSDAKVATIKADGTVTAIAPGTAEITVTLDTYTAKCTVTVYRVEEPAVPEVKPGEEVTEVKPGIDKEEVKTVSGETTAVVEDIITKGSSDKVSDDTAKKVKEAIEAKKAIQTEVVAEPVDEKVVAQEDAAKVEAIITKDAKVAQYLNLEIVLKADDTELGNVTSLSTPITFTVAIPEAMKETPKDVERTFYVVRVHNGQAEKLETKMNKDGQLVFETDKFSTYAIVYEDKTVEQPVVKHQVTFLDKDGNVLSKVEVENGKAVTAPAAPAVDGYHFVKWDSELTNITKDLTIRPVYEKNAEPVNPDAKTYKVTFLNWEGKVITTQNVEEGKNATAPTAPEVKGYHFVKWDSDFTNVKADLVVKAVYEKDSAATTPTGDDKTPSDKKTNDKKDKSSSVNTGDTTNSGLYAGFAMLALVSMGIVVVLRKKQSLHK